MRSLPLFSSALGRKAGLVGALFVAATIAACFPTLPPEDEIDVGTDVAVIDDVTVVDVNIIEDVVEAPTRVERVRVVSLEADGMRISWAAFPNAGGYRVYRDGALISGTSPVETLDFLDKNTVVLASKWGPPQGLLFTSDRIGQMTLIWTVPERPSGEPVDYTVTAIVAGGETTPSEGFSATPFAPAITNFEVFPTYYGRAGTDWISVVGGADTRTWVFDGAPLNSFSHPFVSVGRGGSGLGVELSAEGAWINEVEVKVVVRARLSDGSATIASIIARGVPPFGNTVITWERADREDATYMELIDSAGDGSFLDTTAKAGRLYWYHAIASAEGVAPKTSLNSVGWVRGGVIQITAGRGGACARTADGGAWCWGSSPRSAHQWGSSEDTIDIATAKESCLLSQPSSVQCRTVALSRELPWASQSISRGDGHACVIATTGGSFCWGLNTQRQLGDGTAIPSDELVQVRSGSGAYVGDLVRVKSSDAGQHTCALSSSARLWCWGGSEANYSGYLGHGLTENSGYATQVDLDGVTAYSLGTAHTCAIASGLVYCWGDDTSGQVSGVEPASQINYGPVLVAGLVGAMKDICAMDGASCALKEDDGTVHCWGTAPSFFDFPHLSRLGTEAGFSALACGGTVVCGLKANEMLCAGRDSFGLQLNPGSVQDFVPMQFTYE